MKDNLKDISYIIHGINPNNKVQIWWHELKTSISYMIPYSIREFYRKHIITLWRPQHSRIRKCIPKYWNDLDYVLLTVNFEIIKSFYEDEFVDGPIDWNSDQKHKKFAKWLTSAYKYITEERNNLEKQIEKAYPDLSKVESGKRTYKDLYGKVDELEKEMFDKDTKVLCELLKNRQFLWT